MMTIKLLKFLFCGVLIGSFAVPVSAESRVISLEQIRQWVIEKKTQEAAEALRENHKHIVKSEKNLNDVVQWFSVFLYEDSMAAYEKALESIEKKPSEAEEELHKIFRAEAYNKPALQVYISLLIDQNRRKEAREFIEKTARQLPFLYILDTYGAYLALMGESVKATLPTVGACEKKGFNEIEIDFCNLTRLITQVKAGQDVKKISAKIAIPDGNYWLWEATKNKEYLKKYLTLCQALSEKAKKNYRIVPGVCVKLREAEKHLKPAGTDDTNTP